MPCILIDQSGKLMQMRLETHPWTAAFNFGTGVGSGGAGVMSMSR